MDEEKKVKIVTSLFPGPCTTLEEVERGMAFFTNALQAAQASIDKSLGIDEKLASDAMGSESRV